MRKQYLTILNLALQAEKKDVYFIPAFAVKRVKAMPTEYRKRCSELVKLKLLVNNGLININGHCYGSFSITERGEKLC